MNRSVKIYGFNIGNKELLIDNTYMMCMFPKIKVYVDSNNEHIPNIFYGKENTSENIKDIFKLYDKYIEYLSLSFPEKNMKQEINKIKLGIYYCVECQIKLDHCNSVVLEEDYILKDKDKLIK